MKLQDLLDESAWRRNLFPGGDLEITDHLMQRAVERRIPPAVVSKALMYAVAAKRTELENVPVDSKFVLRDPTGMGIPIIKRERPDGSIYWSALTIHKNLINKEGVPEIVIPRVLQAPTQTKDDVMRISEIINEEEVAKKSDNFTAADLKSMERMTDINQIKAFAKKLIATPSAKPIKPEKVMWLNRQIDTKRKPIDVIKLMYDLLLSGDGNAVIGSKGSTRNNSYRGTFGEGEEVVEQEIVEDEVNEEEIDEISNNTVKSYINKSFTQMGKNPDMDPRKLANRKSGMKLGTDKAGGIDALWNDHGKRGQSDLSKKHAIQPGPVNVKTK